MGRVQDCQRAQLQEYCQGTGICWNIGPESSQTLEVSLVIVTVSGLDSIQEVAIMMGKSDSGRIGILQSQIQTRKRLIFRF